METPAPIASKTVDPVLVRVYVSSTWLDLQPERKAIESALQKFRETKFVGMEYFGSHDEDTRSASLNELVGVNLYIGIFAARYGSGITEDEYRLAVKSQIPCRIYFKKDSAVQDMRETDPNRIRKLENLKADLRKAYTVYEFDTAESLALQLAADFHKWLFDDYIAPRLNGALRGAIDPAEAQALLSNIKDVGALQQELLSRLDNFLIGYAKLHTYPQLDDFILDFEQDMESATRGFTGREFVFEEMEAFAQNNSRGYFRLVADAGLGKTALAAAVSRRLRTPSFFASSTKGLSQPYQCLNHLSADLIIRFHLVRDHLPERSGENSAFLSSVLAEAVQTHSGPLWIVVDAVDEGGSPPPGQNPFLLPSQLPDGVFLFVTHRDDFPWQVESNTVDHVCRLKAFDPAQQTDIRNYLQNEARRPEIAKVMATAQPPIPIERFVTVLSKASEGNFKYLDYVIADIAAKRLPPGSLVPDVLPKGLNGYYDAFWKSMEAVQGKEGWSEWNSLYRPVIAFLAAARQPVTSEWLADLTGRVAEEITERALIPWRRFLRQDQSGPSTAWSIVHRSFADFLARNKKVDLRAAHGRVATFYLSRWGGLDTGLPVLANPAAGDFHILYGVRNLIAHLHEAGRTSELHRLLRLERSHGLEKHGNLWRHAHESCTGGLGYLRDLDLARKVAAADSETALARQNPLEALGLETRYTLLISSIGSLAGNLPAELTAALVRAGVWTPERAYHYALLIPSEPHRAETLALVSGSLPEDLKKSALQHARAAARAVQNTGSRVTALLAVAQCAGARDRTSIIEEALADMPSGSDEISIAYDLHAVAAYLDDSRLDRFLQVATSMTDQTYRLIAFKGLAPVLAQRRFQEALNMARSFEQETPRAQALTALAHVAPEPSRPDLVRETLQAVRAIGPEEHRMYVLIEVAPFLSQVLVEEAIGMADAINDLSCRRAALLSLFACLPQPAFHRLQEIAETQRTPVHGRSTGTLLTSGPLDQTSGFESDNRSAARTLFSIEEARAALDIVRPSEDKHRGLMLATLIPRLPEDTLDDAVHIAAEIEDESWRDAALAALAPKRPEAVLRSILDQGTPGPLTIRRLSPHLSDDQKIRLLGPLASAPRPGDRKAALNALTPSLSPALLPAAVKAAAAIGDKPERVGAMIAFTSPDLSDQVFPQVVAAVDGLENISERARCLTALLPRLPDALKPEVQTKALASAALIPDFIQRASLVASIDPQLRLQDVPAAIGRINETIQAAVDSIPEEQIQTPLGNFLADVEYGAVQRLLGLYGDVLDQPQIEQVLKGVRSIRFPRPRAHALAALATRLSGPLKDRVRGEALDVARECENIDVMLASWYTGAASTLADVLSTLHADISEAQASEAAAKIRSTADPFSRAAATYYLLMSFVGFPDPDRNLAVLNELLNDAWNAIRSLEREWDWADLAGRFYPLAGKATRNAILQRMPTLKDGGAVVAILRSFASEVSDAQWPEVFRFVAQMPPNEVNKEFIQGMGPGAKVRPEIIAESGGRGARAKALAVLAPHVPDSLLGDALDLALELGENRTAAIAPLLARILKLPPANALPLFRKVIASLAAGPRREYLQCAYALVPVITSLGGLAAAAEAIRAIDDCGRWWP